MKALRIIGVMSGTSLDGLDVVCVDFSFTSKIEYKVIASACFEYNDFWQQKLKLCTTLDAVGLHLLSNEFARYTANCINTFIKENAIPNVDYISSHGHTVYHQPQKSLTLQIGNGAVIAANTKTPTICDFRTADVALGGQGAPLVPIGDEMLFSEYDACLNIGGFANISFKNNENKRVAFDICPANIILNQLAHFFNQPYDKDGLIAKRGNLDDTLFQKLNSIPFYAQPYPKSLGYEWTNDFIWPIIGRDINDDTITTFTHHIAYQIANALDSSIVNCLATGGGVYNLYLLDLIKKYNTKTTFVVPNSQNISYKEAIIFALLGYLRVNQNYNSLKEVTGASQNSCGGAIYWI